MHLPEHPALGTCRVCSVKVNGRVTAACAVTVSDGMTVEVTDPETTSARKALVEMLFSEGTHNCPSCEKSGRCTLQAVGYEVEMVSSPFPYQFHERVNDHAAQNIWLERDRCIFCQRCVEFIRDRETGKKIFSISGRGTHARIEIDAELADRMPPEQVREASTSARWARSCRRVSATTSPSARTAVRCRIGEGPSSLESARRPTP